MKNFSVFIFLIFISSKLFSQCTTCSIDYTITSDGVYPDTLPAATAGEYYEADITFVLKTDTTVDVLGVPTTFSFLNYHILNPLGMPYGINATSNLGEFPVDYDPSVSLYGCARVCGTPLVPGFYVITVPLIATLESPAGDQPAEYYLYLQVLPPSGLTGGIIATSSFGCSPLTVDFTTGYPSGGLDGFTYTWDFGNGLTSSLENPPAQIYTTTGAEPQQYIITHTVTVDTFNYTLDYITIDETNCNDCPVIIGCTGLTTAEKPDMYIIIDALGINTWPGYADTDPPVTFIINTIVDAASSYTMYVKDDDAGPTGGDDNCGNLNFNGDDVGVNTYDIGSSTVDVSISHPVISYTFTDTIIVYPYPTLPVINVSGETIFCEGDSAILSATGDTSYTYQWMNDGELIADANSQNYIAYTSGNYSVIATGSGGCADTSAVQNVSVYTYPPPPAIIVIDGNILTTESPYDLQWYYEGSPIPGATDSVYTVALDGTYQVLASNGPCTAISGEVEIILQNISQINSFGNLNIHPNPSSGLFTLAMNLNKNENIFIALTDMVGNKIYEKTFYNISGNLSQNFSLQGLTDGIYILHVKGDSFNLNEKVVKQ